jgi:predicted nucleic acid-binding protein
MKKFKIYLDTSVLGYLDQHDDPSRMTDTRKLWEKIKSGEFLAVISDVTLLELEKCHEAKRKILLDYLKEISLTIVEAEGDDRIVEIAGRFVNLGILRQKSFDDCRHIAAAITSGCDIIVSWNFRHIVNLKTIRGVKAITALEGYDDLLIYTPSILAGGEGNDPQHN